MNLRPLSSICLIVLGFLCTLAYCSILLHNDQGSPKGHFNLSRHQADLETGLDRRQPFMPLPPHWTFKGFNNERTQEAAVRASLEDTYQLAYRAWINLHGQLTPSYYRYFLLNQLEGVKITYRNILRSIGIEAPLPDNTMVWPYQNVVFFGDMEAENKCSSQPKVYAYAHAYNKDVPPLTANDYNIRDDLEDCAICLCPRFFDSEKLRAHLSDITCKEVKQQPWAKKAWMNTASTLLHEFLHCPNVALDHNDRLRDAYVSYSDDRPYQAPDGRPYALRAYGPYLSMWKNRVRAAGALNPDNYVYYALEIYLEEKCKPELEAAYLKDPPRDRWILPIVPTFLQENPVEDSQQTTSNERPPDPEPE